MPSTGGDLDRLAIYASAPASVDRAAADILGERFFGHNDNAHPDWNRTTGKPEKFPRHFRASCSERFEDLAAANALNRDL
jgi:hypothetical protein